MIVVAARCSFESGECLASVGRAIGGSLHHVYDVGVARINVHAADVTASDDARVACDFAPRVACIVRTKKSLPGDREHSPAAHAWSDCQSDAIEGLGGQTLACNLAPGGAFIRRSIDPSVLFIFIVGIGGRVGWMPHRGKDFSRITGIRAHIGDAIECVFRKGARPSLAAVNGFKNSMFRGFG